MITLCIIAKNEAATLPRCIGSVKQVVGQIVVIDTGSTDETKKTAMSLGAEVHDFAWCDDFAAARNAALSYAKGDWVLVLDADETIALHDAKRLAQLIASRTDAFFLVQRNYTNDATKQDFVTAQGDSYQECKGYAGWVPSLIVRLFRNRKEYRFSGVMHELVEQSIRNAGGKMAESGIPIHHFREEASQEKKEEKLRFYLRLAEKKAAQEHSWKAWLELCQLRLQSNDVHGALDACKKSIAAEETTYGRHALGQCLLQQKNTASAITAFKRAIELNQHFPQPHFSLGVAYFRQGKLNDAKNAILAGLQLNPDDTQAYINLAVIYEKGGMPEKALEFIEVALQDVPGNARALRVKKRLRAAL